MYQVCALLLGFIQSREHSHTHTIKQNPVITKNYKFHDHSHTHMHTPTHKRSLSMSLVHDTHSHTYIYIHTHTRAHTHSHNHPPTPTHTIAWDRSASVSFQSRVLRPQGYSVLSFLIQNASLLSQASRFCECTLSTAIHLMLWMLWSA